MPERVHISVMDYDGSSLEEHIIPSAEDCHPFRDSPTISWINIDGLGDIKAIQRLGNHFGLDTLIQEDILDTEQRPKVEIFEDSLFLSLKMLSYNHKNEQIDAEQVSLILGRNYVLSFQERLGDVFEPVRSRLRNSRGPLRFQGADFLIYSMIDVVVDNYYTVLSALYKDIEKVEDIVYSQDSRLNQSLMREIQQKKRQIHLLQHSIHPLRECIAKIQRNESQLVEQRTRKYFNDLREHTIQVIENIETCHNTLVGVQEIYLSSLSHKMNQVIQVLTIISTVFIPLTFIVGVYGMNFRYMPELQSPHGYWMVWGVMSSIVLVQLIYFRRKGWI